MWHNRNMAKGWESKSVESQIEEAKSQKTTTSPAQRDAERLRKQSERNDLQLSRIRVLRELEAAKNLRHRESLTAALKFLDEKIAKLG